MLCLTNVEFRCSLFAALCCDICKVSHIAIIAIDLLPKKPNQPRMNRRFIYYLKQCRSVCSSQDVRLPSNLKGMARFIEVRNNFMKSLCFLCTLDQVTWYQPSGCYISISSEERVFPVMEIAAYCPDTSYIMG